MRVLLAFHSLVTRSNHRLAEELASSPELELTVVAPTWWPEESRDVQQEVRAGRGYRLVALPALHGRRPHPNLFLYRCGLGRALRESKPDLLDLYEEPFSLAAAQLLLLRALWARRSALLFYSAQNICKRYPPPFSLIERWAFRAASHAHVCNREAGEVLRRKGYRGPVHLLPLGVDHERFTPARDRVAAKRALGLEGTVVGYLGRLHLEKGVRDLLEAFAGLGLPTATLLLVGAGPHRARLEEGASALGIARRVVFAGPVDRPRTPRYLRAMDCLVVPSRTTLAWKEQFGRVIVEAFLSGVPVIGSSSGSIPELIRGDGFLYSEGDVPALTGAIRAVLRDPAGAHLVAQRARARALRDYTWQAVAAQRLALYREALAAGGGRRTPIAPTP
jgi:glycosyltransferase involved in cell wall biosynthesis